jgi:putative membrane protein
MKMDLLLGRRVFRNTLVLTTTVLTCTALQAKDDTDNDKDKPHRTGATAEHHADKGGAMTAEKFVQKAMAGGQMEVQMGQLGQQQAQNQQVKQLAATLVKDHTEANQRLEQIASTKNITVDKTGGEHAKHQKHLDKLKGQSGTEFDKEFVRMALKDHKKDIAEFEKCQSQVNDPELKSFITQTLPKLRQHLQKRVSPLKLTMTMPPRQAPRAAQ